MELIVKVYGLIWIERLKSPLVIEGASPSVILMPVFSALVFGKSGIVGVIG